MPRPALSDETLEDLGRLLHDQPLDECHAWLDLETGEVVLATSLYGLEEEDGDDEGVVALHPGGQIDLWHAYEAERFRASARAWLEEEIGEE